MRPFIPFPLSGGYREKADRICAQYLASELANPDPGRAKQLLAGIFPRELKPKCELPATTCCDRMPNGRAEEGLLG